MQSSSNFGTEIAATFTASVTSAAGPSPSQLAPAELRKPTCPTKTCERGSENWQRELPLTAGNNSTKYVQNVNSEPRECICETVNMKESSMFVHLQTICDGLIFRFFIICFGTVQIFQCDI